MKNVWLDSNTVSHESVQKTNNYTDSRIDYSKEIRQLQGNTFQIPIVPTQRTNASFEKTKTVPKKDPRLKHLKKVCLSYINISSVTNKLETLLAFVCTQVDFLAISETKNLIAPSQQYSLTFRVLGLHIGKIQLREKGGYLYM